MSIHHLERAALLPLQATRKLVLMALCDDADKTTGVAMPGIEAVMQWAGCGRSQAQEHLAALIEAGYVERVSAGARGRRAEFRVFARVACCAEHEPTAPVVASGEPDPTTSTPEPVDNPAPETTPEPNASGKGPERVRLASGLDRTPLLTPQPPNQGEGSSPTSPAAVDNSRPSPLDDLGGRLPDPMPLTRPDRCRAHQLVDIAPPCGACKDARLAEERRQAAALAAVRAVAERRERAPACPEHPGGRVGWCSGCAADHKAGDHRAEAAATCHLCAAAGSVPAVVGA